MNAIIRQRTTVHGVIQCINCVAFSLNGQGCWFIKNVWTLLSHPKQGMQSEKNTRNHVGTQERAQRVCALPISPIGNKLPRRLYCSFSSSPASGNAPLEIIFRVHACPECCTNTCMYQHTLFYTYVSPLPNWVSRSRGSNDEEPTIIKAYAERRAVINKQCTTPGIEYIIYAHILSNSALLLSTWWSIRWWDKHVSFEC